MRNDHDIGVRRVSHNIRLSYNFFASQFKEHWADEFGPAKGSTRRAAYRSSGVFSFFF